MGSVPDIEDYGSESEYSDEEPEKQDVVIGVEDIGFFNPKGIASKFIQYTYEALNLITDNFKEENFIGKTQSGEVYRGKIQEGNGTEAKDVTVKIWVDSKIYPVFGNTNDGRFTDEIRLLQPQIVNSHPGLVKLIGYCREGQYRGVVYDLKPLDTVHNLTPNDEFKWPQRIKVAIGFACILESFPSLLRNIAAAHIMLDQDYNPKLFDFSMISGGSFPHRIKWPNQYVHGCYGYIDEHYGTTGLWSKSCDVFSYGVLLLGLLTKRIFKKAENGMPSEPFVYEWARNEYKKYKAKKSMLQFRQSKFSLVQQNLKAAPEFCPSDGYKLTKLAMQCVEYCPDDRPTMKDIVDSLLKLRVVQHHADVLGINQFLCVRDAN